MWRDRRFVDLVGIEHPILLAPMAGPGGAALAAAVSAAGGLGGLPCAMLTPDLARTEINRIRQQTERPFNVNFFSYTAPAADAARDAAWRGRMAGYYAELGLDVAAAPSADSRKPFDAAMCELMEELRPRVVSFHFGLPDSGFVARLKAAGCLILSSATTVREARWLEDAGADAIIAQGAEAGGHRAMFLTEDVATQVGSMALIPQVVDAVRVPVVAAGGIGDARGIAAALVLGASAVQLGTAYLQCPEALTPPMHRAALADAADDATVLTNVMSGRPARGFVNRVIRELGPINAGVAAFPGAASVLSPLRSVMEKQGSSDFSAMWSGQAAPLAQVMPAGELTATLALAALARLAG